MDEVMESLVQLSSRVHAQMDGVPVQSVLWRRLDAVSNMLAAASSAARGERLVRTTRTARDVMQAGVVLHTRGNWSLHHFPTGRDYVVEEAVNGHEVERTHFKDVGRALDFYEKGAEL